MVAKHTEARAWHTLGATGPHALADAWRQLHWAAQVPAAFASSGVEARPDDSHLNLGWDDPSGALLTRAAGPVRAGLRLADLTLLVLGGAGAPAEYPLGGHTLSDGLDWMREAAGRAMEAPPAAPLAPRGWDMPEHAVGAGARFEPAPPAAFEEVARWYANVDLVLGELAAATEGASEVRCWPHHFDLATFVSLDAGRTSGDAPSVGIGLAPADAGIDEPYVYANPRPRPEAPAPPTLEAGGEWHREGWFGAVLRASRLLEGDAAGQRARLEVFLRSAVAADRRLLGEED